MHDAPYRPISCDFHDLLEAAATRRDVVTLEIRGAGDRSERIEATIADIVTLPEGEYLQTETGRSVRLDHVVSIDGASRSDYPD
ncbi:MAG: Rho-binding antiterminator [Luteimonas sp.]